jgi:hypothetical protein
VQRIWADQDDLATITPGCTTAQNAPWRENSVDPQFRSSRRIVVAEIKGSAEITMMYDHEFFASGKCNSVAPRSHILVSRP